MGRGGMCILFIILFGTWRYVVDAGVLLLLYPLLFLKVPSPFNFFFSFAFLLSGEEGCGCFSFDLTPCCLGRKETRRYV